MVAFGLPCSISSMNLQLKPARSASGSCVTRALADCGRIAVGAVRVSRLHKGEAESVTNAVEVCRSAPTKGGAGHGRLFHRRMREPTCCEHVLQNVVGFAFRASGCREGPSVHRFAVVEDAHFVRGDVKEIANTSNVTLHVPIVAARDTPPATVRDNLNGRGRRWSNRTGCYGFTDLGVVFELAAARRAHPRRREWEPFPRFAQHAPAPATHDAEGHSLVRRWHRRFMIHDCR